MGASGLVKSGIDAVELCAKLVSDEEEMELRSARPEGLYSFCLIRAISEERGFDPGTDNNPEVLRSKSDSDKEIFSNLSNDDGPRGESNVLGLFFSSSQIGQFGEGMCESFNSGKSVDSVEPESKAVPVNGKEFSEEEGPRECSIIGGIMYF